MGNESRIHTAPSSTPSIVDHCSGSHFIYSSILVVYFFPNLILFYKKVSYLCPIILSQIYIHNRVTPTTCVYRQDEKEYIFLVTIWGEAKLRTVLLKIPGCWSACHVANSQWPRGWMQGADARADQPFRNNVERRELCYDPSFRIVTCRYRRIYIVLVFAHLLGRRMVQLTVNVR